MPFDPRPARRALRKALLMTTKNREERTKIPRSYEADALLRYAHRTIAGRNRVDLDLLAAAGRGFGLSGKDAEGAKYLQEGIDRTRAADQAFFRYLLGHFHHNRLHEYRAAERELLHAVAICRKNSPVSIMALLALAEAQTSLGSHDAAAESCERALNYAPEFEPRVNLILSRAAHDQRQFPVAERLNRQAHREFQDAGSELGVTKADLRLGQIYLDSGRNEAALKLFARTERDLRRIGDVTHLGPALARKGVALHRLGRASEAVAAFTDALRFSAEAGRAEDLAMAYRNLALGLEEDGRPATAVAVLAGLSGGEDATEDFRHMNVAVGIFDRNRSVSGAPAFLARLHALLPKAGRSVEREDLLAAMEASGRLAASKVVPSGDGSAARLSSGLEASARRDARFFLDVPQTHERVEDLIAARVGADLRARMAPSAEDLVKFFATWTARWFRNTDYQDEFLVPQILSKFHLRTLRLRGALELQGTKRGSKYRPVVGLA
jgi:tetratricopeptide (TPR) repeat protein